MDSSNNMDDLLVASLDESFFDFNQWIEQHNLQSIKQCFTDQNMTTLDSLDMNHANFSQFVADATVLANAHLLATVVSAIQSLGAQQQNQTDQTQTPNSAEQEPRLIFLTQKENHTFVTLEQYVSHERELQTEFSSVIPSALNDRKQRSTQRIERYSQTNSEALEAMRTSISGTVHRLHAVLHENEKRIQKQLNQYREDVRAVDSAHSDHAQRTQQILHDAVGFADADIESHQKRLVECRDIVSKYEDMDVDDANGQFMLDNDENREHEIVQIGETSKAYYNKQTQVFADMKLKISQYMEPRLVLNVDQRMHFVAIHVAVYQSICEHVQQRLMQCRDTRVAVARAPQRKNNQKSKPKPKSMALASAASARPQMVIQMDTASQSQLEKEHVTRAPPMAYSVSYPDHELLSTSHVDKCDEFSEGPPTPPPLLPSAPTPTVDESKNEDSEIAMFAAIREEQQFAYHRAREQSIGAGLKEQPQEPQVQQSMWKCSVCTFEENQALYLVCGMCGSSQQMSLDRTQAMSLPASPQSAPVLLAQSNSEYVSDVHMKRSDSQSASRSEKLKFDKKSKGDGGKGGNMKDVARARSESVKSSWWKPKGKSKKSKNKKHPT